MKADVQCFICHNFTGVSGFRNCICDQGAGGAKRPGTRLKAKWGWVQEGVTPPARGVRDITPGKFLKLQMLIGEF